MTVNFVNFFSIFSIFGILLLVASQTPPMPFTNKNTTHFGPNTTFPPLPAVDENKEQNWKTYESKWKEEEKDKIVQQRPLIFGSDGSCWIRDGDEYKEAYINENPVFNCLDDFLNFAMQPACGNPFYEMIKVCAKRHVYQAESFEESKLATGDAHEKMRALALLDGCFVCNLTKALNDKNNIKYATVKVTYLLPVGSFWTNCGDETAIAMETTISIESTVSTFTVPMNFFVRKCNSLFSVDDPPEKYEQIKMEVKHNCNEENEETSFTVDLADFAPSAFPNNFAEMRYVQFDLVQGLGGISKKKKNAATGGIEVEKIDVEKLEWDNRKSGGNEEGGHDEY